MMTFVGQGGVNGGSLDGDSEDVSIGGCEAGSVGEYKNGGCDLNVCDGEDGGDGCWNVECDVGGNGCCGGVGQVE